MCVSEPSNKCNRLLVSSQENHSNKHTVCEISFMIFLHYTNLIYMYWIKTLENCLNRNHAQQQQQTNKQINKRIDFSNYLFSCYDILRHAKHASGNFVDIFLESSFYQRLVPQAGILVVDSHMLDAEVFRC